MSVATSMHVCPNRYYDGLGRGKGQKKNCIRLYLRTAGCRQIPNMHFQEYSALCFPGMSSRKIFRIEHLADEFIFTGNGTDSHSHTQAPRRHFIQALVGEYGSTEIVAAAENEIGRRQVYAVDVVRYDFRRIRRDECEAEPYCQAAQQSLAFSRFRRNDHEYFVLFFSMIVCVIR